MVAVVVAVAVVAVAAMAAVVAVVLLMVSLSLGASVVTILATYYVASPSVTKCRLALPVASLRTCLLKLRPRFVVTVISAWATSFGSKAPRVE